MPDRRPSSPDRPLFIGIGGGSGSGKTTVAEALIERLDDGVVLIQHDAYYRHAPHLTFEERSKVNYDHPDSLETELLIEHLAMLREGLPVERPVYDFVQHLRSGDVVKIEPSRVLLVERILGRAEPDLRADFDHKNFVDTDHDSRHARRRRRN